MSFPYSQEDREYMVLEALKAKAPKTYRELKKSNRLQKFVEDQANLLLELYESQLFDAHQAADQGPKAGYLEQLSAILHAQSQLTEQTLGPSAKLPGSPDYIIAPGGRQENRFLTTKFPGIGSLPTRR
jgi:hypothetical protein